MKLHLVLAIFALSSIVVYSYPGFMRKIPNHESVINPMSGKKHVGVGHISEWGKGPRNCFGQDFSNAGNMWTKAFCSMDSDGDGMTNGEELGDPNCLWNEKKPEPKPTRNVTHPGICTPLDTDRCKSFNHINSTCSYDKIMSTATNASGYLVGLGWWTCAVVVLRLMY